MARTEKDTVRLGDQLPLVLDAAWVNASLDLPDGLYWYSNQGWDTQVVVRIETAMSSRAARQVRFAEWLNPEYLGDLPRGAKFLPIS